MKNVEPSNPAALVEIFNYKACTTRSLHSHNSTVFYAREYLLVLLFLGSSLTKQLSIQMCFFFLAPAFTFVKMLINFHILNNKIELKILPNIANIPAGLISR